ncbi:hypothetical protein [Bradyrhizobium sp. NP1]|uniref:hypothetical protein n=1 Tax=Bradyrhizobium sp. NP1 TaxID=3049772 RepID=UPI0025A59D07|nr:hypothetical protein [Bradyrhizobium sp. NP1]WJR75530.1 hypothetical protein QOU61_22320 [Bradyrhizobium sp. NP1]
MLDYSIDPEFGFFACRWNSKPSGSDPQLTWGRLLYSAFAETFRALGRIDFAAWLRWLLDLQESRAITGGANNFAQTFARLFHKRSIAKARQKVEFMREDSGRLQQRATKLPS